MEKFRNKFSNVKSIFTILLVAICIAVVASIGLLKSKITVDQNQAVESLYAGGTLTSEDIIVRACKLLGKTYGNNGEKGGDAYRTNPTFYEATDSRLNSIDCSGLVYWTLGGLGVRTLNVSDFRQDVGLPVDTTHWLTYNKNGNIYYWKECSGDASAKSVKASDTKLKYTLNGTTYDIKVLKANETITTNNRYYQYNNGEKLPAGTIVVSYGEDPANSKTKDHAWITLGDLGTSDAQEVKSILKNMGVTVSDDVLNRTVKNTGGTSTYWRIESNAREGVVINNGDPNPGDSSSGKSIDKIWAFQLAPEVKGDYTLEVKKYDENGQELNIGQDVFSITKNGNRISPLTIDGNKVTVKEKLDKISVGNIDTYIIKEENAPNGFIKYEKELKLEILTKNRNGKKIGSVKDFYINGVKQTKVGGSFQYDDGLIEMNFSETNSYINVKVKNKKPEGQYNININKKDTKLNPLKGASFLVEKIEQSNNSFTGSWSTVSTEEFNGTFEVNPEALKIKTVDSNDIIKIEEVNSPAGYQLFNKQIVLQVIKKMVGNDYVIDHVNVFAFDKNEEITADSLINASAENNYFVDVLSADKKEFTYSKSEDADNIFVLNLSDDLSTINVTVENKRVDLALKKRITKINDVKAMFTDENVGFNIYQDRFLEENVEQSMVTWGYETENYTNVSTLESTTNALYFMNKTPVEVRTGDVVEYSIKVFNEGEVKAKASIIKDYYGKGLSVQSVKYKGEDINYTLNEETNVLTIDCSDCDFIDAFNGQKLACDEIIVTCKVNDDATGLLTNVAEIAKYETELGEIDEDIDSTPNNWQSPNGDGHNEDTDKSTDAWKDYATDTPDGWKETYLAQDDGVNSNKGDDDDFEKVIVKGKATLRIRKLDNNNVDVDTIKFDIKKNNDTTETDVVIDSSTKRIEREFELNPIGEQETTYIIQEQANSSYVQLLGPIEIKAVSMDGKLQGYYFTYNNGTPRSDEMETTRSKVFNCPTANGITLAVRVVFDAESSTIDVVINNVIVEQPDYGIVLKKVSSADMETPLAGVTFKGTKQIGGGVAEPITDSTGAEGLVTGADGYTEMIKTPMSITNYREKDIYNINEIDLGTANSDYTKLNTNIVIRVSKTIDSNYKLLVRDFEVELYGGQTGWTSVQNKQTLTAYDDAGRAYPIIFEEKTADNGTKYLEVAVSNIPSTTLPLYINKLEVNGDPITEEGTEVKVLKETLAGDAQLYSGVIENGLLKIPDAVKADDTTATYKIYETKAATNHKNIFGDKYIKLTVSLENGVPTATSCAIYLANEEQENDELLDYIDSRVSTKTIDENEIKVVELDIENPEVEKKVDLALKKIITQIQVNGVYKDVNEANGFDAKYDRLTHESIVSNVLGTEPNHDALYFLNKTPILVTRGAKVKYQIRIYNESSEQTATASEIIDYLPDGLKLAKNGDDYAVYYRDEQTPLSSSEYSYNEDTNTLKITALANKELIPVYDAENDNLYKDYITVECIVEDSASGILTNMAQISKYITPDGIIDVDIDSVSGNWRNPVDDNTANNEHVDRSSSFWKDYIGEKVGPRKNYYVEGAFKNYLGQEDDDDFEKIEVAEIDLALKKIITKVNDTPESEFIETFRRFQEGRVNVDVTKLNTTDYKTGEYFLNKTPIKVAVNDSITYQIRIYNEGTIDATASKIIDYIPKGLTLAKEDGNYCVYYQDETTPLSEDYYTYDPTTNVLEITKLSDELIPKYTGTAQNLVEPSYTYVTVKCNVTGAATGLLTNVAEIAKYKTMFDETNVDRDSQTVGNGEWKEPSGSNKKTLAGKSGDAWARYYDNIKTGQFADYPGQQDDDDFEKVLVTGKVSVKLRKVSKIDNAALEGITFTVNGEDVTTDSNGNIDLGEWEIDTGHGLGIFNIQEKSTNGNYVVIQNPIWLGLVPGRTSQGGAKFSGYYMNLKEPRAETGSYVNQVPSERTFNLTTTEIGESAKYMTGTDPKSQAIREKATFYYSLKLVVKVTEDEEVPGNYNVELVLENTVPRTLYDLFIKKLDDAENVLSGVKFKTQSDSMFNSTINYSLVTDEEGNAYIGRYTISEDNYDDVDTIKIEEIETTYKHYLLAKDLYLQVKKGLNSTGTGYEVKNVKLIYGKTGEDGYQESNEGKDIMLDDVKVAGSDETVTIKAKVIAVQNSEGERAQRITITVENKEKKFDLSLRKYIIQAGDEEITRWSENEVDATKLASGEATTATYNNAKEPVVEVHLRDTVRYGIRVYNEGEIGGYAEYVIDDVPEGLEMIVPGDGAGNTSKVNSDYRWKMYRLIQAGETAELTYKGQSYVETDDPELAKIIGTDYLSKAYGEEIISDVEGMENPNFMRAFDPETMDTPIGKEVEVEFKVKESVVPGTIIENKAQIYRHGDEIGDTTIEDRDSTPGEWQDSPRDDDQDIERIVVLRDKEYDLALRKFITKVNDKELKESREPQVDCTKLLVGGTTADKNHTKDPVLVKPQDVVEYTIRVYNEGKDDAYAETIIDDVPKGTKMIAPEYDEDGKPLNMNAEYGWVMYRLATEEETEDIASRADLSFLSYDDDMYISTENADEAVLIMTDYLSYRRNAVANLIKAFNPANREMKPENWRDVKVQYSVCEQDEMVSEKALINYAQIGSMADENGNTDVTDRDSTPGEWINDEDDQDIEQLKVGYFDLALYKWVSTAIVTEDGKTTEYASEHTQADKSNVVNVSIPKDKLNKVTVKFKYQIKVENEGTVPGKALEITDHLPEGLKFVEEDNKEFGWKQNEDGTIVTDYLKDTVLNPRESAEVTVVATWINGSENFGKKINYAEISKDENDYGWPDIDSVPGNFTDKPSEDDEDGDEVLLQIRTGASAVAYVVIGLVAMVIVAGGAFGIKKFIINK